MRMPESTLPKQISSQLFEKLELAYSCVDKDKRVVTVSDNWAKYGFQEIHVGDLIDDHLDFMIGFEVDTEIDLALVSSPNGTPLSVSLMPKDGVLTILVTNASVQAEQRQKLQQQANENELLLRQQKILSRQLSKASKELEHKNLELREAARLQSSFLSGVSHEFRTPLTSIIGYTNLLRHDIETFDRQNVQRIGEKNITQEYLQAVQRSSKHLLSLVENLLDHGKFDSNEIVIRPKACNLNEIFNDVYILSKPLAETKSLEFEFDIDALRDLDVLIDDARLRQCLINILSNAIKFTDHGKVALRALIDKETLSIRIDDTGSGISEEDLEKIRLPFYQVADTGKVGTGLGLTITERIVEIMGGQIEIQSELGKGTTVLIQMPVAMIQQQKNDVDNQAIIHETANKYKVLIAEDDTDISVLLELMLNDSGVDSTFVENGALALVEMEQHRFDAVLLDVHMPVMDGYQTMQRLQESNNSVPIIVMSASALDADRSKADELGAAGYLVKPVDADEIVQMIEQVLE